MAYANAREITSASLVVFNAGNFITYSLAYLDRANYGFAAAPVLKVI